MEGGGGIGRNPAVAVVGDTLETFLRARSEQHRRAARLHRLRPAPDRIEVDELAVELSVLLRPDLLHRENPFAQDLPAPLEIGALVLHLFPVPATADPEHPPPPPKHPAR